MAPNHRNFFFFVSVVTLLRREVVNLERRKVVSLNRRTVVSLTGASMLLQQKRCITGQNVTSLNAVEEYLLNHLYESTPCLKRMAETFNVSESTLKRTFKKRHGISISAFFRSNKMKLAHTLISEGKPVAETARLLGYRNVHYFITSYEKYRSKTGKYR